MSWRALCSAVLVLAASGAAAQTFSPGRLGKAHEKYEGLSQCTKCHEVSKKLDGKLCLECHKNIATLLKSPNNFHAHQGGGLEGCVPCHHDHRGVDAPMSEWGTTIQKFDHKRTTWPTEGKHVTKCEKCHQPSYVEDAALKKRFTPGTTGLASIGTFLGLNRSCVKCHYDEHRGQLQGKCDACHDARAFKPAPLYKHDKTFRLNGKHAKTACNKCHGTENDPHPPPASAGAVKAAEFVRYIPTPKACNACHRDPHEGRFGLQCQKCHNESNWHDTHASQATAFHDKTQFPLKGMHHDVACAQCHPPGPKGGIQAKGFPFAHCTDCHADAHFGQIAKDRKEGVIACQKCHNESGFSPSRFPLADHLLTRFPLTGAHASVPCNDCHTVDKVRFAGITVTNTHPTAQPSRAPPVDYTVLHWPEKDVTSCERCHKDPHQGRFQRDGVPQPCTNCHNAQSFQDARFDHNRDSRFKLVGRHAQALCSDCHRPAPDGKGTIYRGTERRCIGCHQDVHEGQFITARKPSGSCRTCHHPEGFKPSLFVHGNPKFSSWELKGKHAQVACNACHIMRKLENGHEARWYRGLPKQCEDCHVSIHEEPEP